MLPQLVGRDEEQAELRRLLDVTRGGVGQSVLLQGEAGIGKTALLEAFGAECRSTDVKVLHSAAHELEHRIPLQTLLSCLSSLAGDAGRDGIASLRATLRGDVGADPLHWEVTAAEHVLALLEGWCADGPAVLLLDDAQWADDFSLAVLGRLRLAFRKLPLLFALALSTGPHTERSKVLQAFEEGVQSLHLSPLGQEHVSRLAGELLKSRPGPALTARLSAAGGNPLFVAEMVRALITRREIRAMGDSAEVDTTAADSRNAPGIPEVVAEIVMRNLEALPPQTREALRTAAVLGPRVDLWELSLILDMPVTKVWG
ncbi:ATP-binding protein, partial [Kitasatospora indigofera]